MTENDEKLAEKLANEYEKKWLCGDKPSFKDGFLTGLAHERARSQKLVEAIRMHLSTMNDINIHLGYQFTQPLINLQKKVKEYDGEAK